MRATLRQKQRSGNGGFAWVERVFVLEAAGRTLRAEGGKAYHLRSASFAREWVGGRPGLCFLLAPRVGHKTAAR